MKSINLRTRLLVVIGFVAILQVVTAAFVYDGTRDGLVDDIDGRLETIASADRFASFDVDTEMITRLPPPGRPPPGVGPPKGRPPANQGQQQVPPPPPPGAPPFPPPPGAPHPPPGAPPFPPPGAPTPPERFGDIYEGTLRADGSHDPFFLPNSTGEEVDGPDLDVASAAESDGKPFTFESPTTDTSYRIVATPLPNGDYFIAASPLTEVDRTLSRLTSAIIATVVIITLVLAFLSWWILRLGIAPIKKMTGTAEAIAAGDLSERIDNPDSRTEAGQLGHALNSMLGQIETSIEERQDAEERLRQFIADASHELRTPVATIRGYAELYRAGGLDDPNQLGDALRRTEQESERMTRLISDMLNLAKLDRQPTLETEPVDLASIALDTAADAKARHPERTMRPHIFDSDIRVEGDEDLLRQALTNVVGNAIVHTDPASTITISAHQASDQAVVTVTDDGDGMSPEDLQRVTERFYRADQSRSRHKGGSGLGLSIVDSVVDAHAGTLVLNSEPGEGTRVTILLPVASAGA